MGECVYMCIRVGVNEYVCVWGALSLTQLLPYPRLLCLTTVHLFSYFILMILINIMILTVIALGSKFSTSNVLNNVKINNGHLCFIHG